MPELPLAVKRALMCLLAAAAVVGLLAAGPADAKRKRGPKVTVMTRNLYLGTDLIPIATAPPDQVEAAVTRGFNNMKATRFGARAKRLAREVKRTRPDLIGLQEVALWRTGPKDGVRSNERKVAFDWLAILRRALKRSGLHYRLGGSQREFDLSGPSSADFDVRLTMRDAILVKQRRGLKIRRRRGANFENLVKIPTAAFGTVTVKRGWVADDLSLRGRRFRFVNTHLEAYGAKERQAQARELIERGGPARSRRPVILVGDMNSDPNGDPNGEGDPQPYRTLVGFNFRDAWLSVHPNSKGYECCLDHKGADGLPDLKDPPPFPNDHRIDFILTKRRLKALRAVRVGLDPRERTAGGLWPSDHGGVVASFRLR